MIFLKVLFKKLRRFYGEFREIEISKTFDNEDFGYTKITVERPILDEDGKPVLVKR